MALLLLLYQAITNSCFSSQILNTQSVQLNRLPASEYLSIVEVEKIHVEQQIAPSQFDEEGSDSLADDVEILANDVIVPSVQKVLNSSIFDATQKRELQDLDITIRIRKTLPGNVFGGFFPDESLSIFQDQPVGKDSLLIYVSEQTPQDAMERTVVHEIFHAWQNRKSKLPNWVVEGLALLFEYKILGTFNFDYYLAAFQKVSTPLTSTITFTESSSTSSSSPETYGHLLLYFYYLDRECGDKNNAFFWSLATKGIANTLKTTQSLNPPCVNFQSSVENFEIARVLNKTLNQGSNVYLIQAKTLDRAAPQSLADAQISLNKIQKNQPVFVTASDSRKLTLPPDLRVYCIKRSEVPSVLALRNLDTMPTYCEYILFLK